MVDSTLAVNEHRLGVLIGMILVSLCTLLGAAGADPLNRVETIKNLSPEQAAAGLHVRFEGTVSYVDPVWKYLFVEQDGHTVFVQGTRHSAHRGVRVRIDGFTAFGDLKPVVEPTSVVGIGVSPLPEPERISLQGLAFGEHDCALVEVEATVGQVVIEDQRTMVWCRDGEVLFAACIARRLGTAEALELVDSQVLLRGNLGAWIDERSQVRSFQLFLQDSDQLQVLVPAETTAAPRTTQLIADILHRGAEDMLFAVHGQVILVNPRSFVMQDERAGIRLDAWTTANMDAGQLVQVYGIRRVSPGGVSFRATVILPLTATPLPEPSIRSAADVLRDTPHYRRVRVQGRVLRQIKGRGEGYRLLLKDGATSFLVRISAAVEHSHAIDPTTIKTVAVTGVCLPEPPELGDAAFEIVVGNLDDISVVERHRTFPLRTVLLVIAALAGLVGLALLWITTLRASVVEKTRYLSDLTAQLLATYEAIDDGIVALHRDGRVLAVNNQTLRLFNASLEPGDPGDDLCTAICACLDNPDELCERWSALQGESSGRESFELKLSLPEPRHLLVSTGPIQDCQEGTTIGRLWVFRDETAKRKLAARLRQAQKMEALGTLAGGIAHDFNNFLSAISSNLAMVRMQQGDTVATVDQQLGVAEEAVFRAAELVRRLLTVSRQAELRLELCSINEVITRLAELARHAFDQSIELRLELDPDLLPVRVDATQLEQILLNLCVNSRDAMPGGGTITLRTWSETDLHGHDLAVIAVRDTGAGMSEELQSKIFEPFFTTKEPGRGTGLGLAVSYGVIRQHGGHLECESRPGKGTEMRVRLPAVRDAVPPARPSRVPTEEYRGSETVMVIDDEPAVRAATVGMLRQHGYTAVAATSGSQALAELERIPGAYDAVLLDLTMPGMSGRETLQRLRELEPRMPVIMCSGYPLDEYLDGFDDEMSPNATLQKPFPAHELLQKLQQVLKAR